MSVTAVPLHPITKGSLTRLWVALAAFALLAAGMAWAGTQSVGYTMTKSGLQFREVKAGSGAHPTTTDIVLIHYTGRLLDGTVFDSSEGKQPIPLPVTGAIPGFTEGLQLMQKGGRYKLRIPSDLAYGPTGTPGGPIPPNADLDFDIELIDVAPQSALAPAGGAGGAGGGAAGPAGGR